MKLNDTKKIILSVILGWCCTTNAQSLTPGDQMPDIPLARTIKGDLVKTSSFKGKLLLIDFWATWCGSCVEGMGHLEELKRAFGNQVEVLALSEESEERLRKFVKARPGTLTIGRDTSGRLRELFPHRTIPHTVIIGPEGKVYAITAASNITIDVLKAVLKRTPIDLPLKKDLIDFDMNTYFKVDSTKPRQFNLLLPVEGVGSRSTTYNDGAYKGRRMTIVNFPMEGLFRIAYDKSYVSTVNEYDTVKRSWDEEEKFCLDAWIEVADPIQLMQFIREELNNHFVDVKATLEKRNRKVLVLQSKDAAKKLLKPSTDNRKYYDAGGDHFNGYGVTLDQLAEYIEGFSLYNGTVVNETGIEGRYDIHIKFQPEIKDAFKDALAELGLYSVEAERPVELLILKKIL